MIDIEQNTAADSHLPITGEEWLARFTFIDEGDDGNGEDEVLKRRKKFISGVERQVAVYQGEVQPKQKETRWIKLNPLGKLTITLRYGSKKLKGLKSDRMEIKPSITRFVETLKDAVDAGAFDTALAETAKHEVSRKRNPEAQE